MKFFGITTLLLLMITLTGCYTVVYQSTESEVVYEEPIYIPVPDPVVIYPIIDPVPYPDPIIIVVPVEQPKEKYRSGDNDSGDRNNSYKERDPLRDRGRRGTEERKNQGR